MAIGTTPKSIIVTGGASGIGLTIVRHFASQGGCVAIFDVNAASGKSIVSDVASEYPQSTVTFHHCDVSLWKEQTQAFSDVYDAFGRIDIVFANAGIAEGIANALATIHSDAPQEPNLKVVAVDLNGVIYCNLCMTSRLSSPFVTVKLAIHYISKNPTCGSSRGSIIFTASDAALYPFLVGPLYAAAKAGVIGLVRSTAPILENLKIQINTMAPAALDKKLNKIQGQYPHQITNARSVTNIIPDPEMYKHMVVTPMSTLIKGVSQIIGDASLNGKVVEIHDEEPTIRNEPY
ncbi:beta-glucosidase A [Colletotrichum acutatum]